MTTPIREYLAQRRSDIQAHIKALKAELVDVDVAERALAAAAGEPERPRRERGTNGSGNRKTLKEMAQDVLSEHREGLEAAGILAEIDSRFGIVVRRESLSPQLSRLGQEGILRREGLVWKLANFNWEVRNDLSQNNETPGVPPPSASSLEVDFDDEIPF